MGIIRKLSLLISLLWGLAFSSCSQKLVVAQVIRVTDTVYVTDTKIYKDTVYVSDTIVRYVNKFDNPVIRQVTADPSVIRKDGIFYLYSTESGEFPNIPIYKSIDLINWYFVDTAFNDRSRPSSIDGNLWAPDINCIKDKYVLYYAQSQWGGEWDCGIGVAVAEHPAGPFVDVGILFDSQGISVRNSIDPFFINDFGKNYLFWGSHRGIYGIELSDDGLSVKEGGKARRIAGNGGEGAYIHKRGNFYYLFLSYGSCCSGVSSTYNVRVGRSLSLFGPYLDRQGKAMLENNAGTTILRGNAFVAGPGHNAEIITDDKGDDWLIYHGYLHEKPEMNRLIFLDRILWEDGWPVMPEGAPSSSSEIPFFE